MKKKKSKSVTYWTEREKQKLKDGLKDIEVIDRKLKSHYNLAAKDIETQIAKLFYKYAEDNELSYKEAKKLLSGKEHKEWRMDLKSYIKEIEENNDKDLLLELNTLSMKSRISRLEEVFFYVNKHVDDVYKFQHEQVEELLKTSVSSNYYQSIYDVQKFIGVGSSFSKLDEKKIVDVVKYPWSGKNYSERIWNNRQKLKYTLETNMTQMIIQGNSPKKIAKNVAERLNVDYKKAMRLVHTEHSYIMSEASAMAMEDTGVEKYQFLATLDGRTSKICQELDLQVFYLKDRIVGLNASPMHPRCRSTEIPYFEDDISTRSARVGNGKTYYVPSNMSYKEWNKEHVE